MQYSQYQQPRSDLKLDQNPYFSQKCFLKSDSFQFSLSGWVLDLSKLNIFYIKMFVLMRRIFYMQHLTTKFQRLGRQNQAQRYLSLENRVFHAYDRPTLAWLVMLVFAIVNFM